MLLTSSTSPRMLTIHASSSRSRACLGKNLAVMELKLITAMLVRHFDVQVGPRTSEDSMAMKAHLIAVPKNGRRELAFTKTRIRGVST